MAKKGKFKGVFADQASFQKLYAADAEKQVETGSDRKLILGSGDLVKEVVKRLESGDVIDSAIQKVLETHPLKEIDAKLYDSSDFFHTSVDAAKNIQHVALTINIHNSLINHSNLASNVDYSSNSNVINNNPIQNPDKDQIYSYIKNALERMKNLDEIQEFQNQINKICDEAAICIHETGSEEEKLDLINVLQSDVLSQDFIRRAIVLIQEDSNDLFYHRLLTQKLERAHYPVITTDLLYQRLIKIAFLSYLRSEHFSTAKDFVQRLENYLKLIFENSKRLSEAEVVAEIYSILSRCDNCIELEITTRKKNKKLGYIDIRFKRDSNSGGKLILIIEVKKYMTFISTKQQEKDMSQLWSYASDKTIGEHDDCWGMLITAFLVKGKFVLSSRSVEMKPPSSIQLQATGCITTITSRDSKTPKKEKEKKVGDKRKREDEADETQPRKKKRSESNNNSQQAENDKKSQGPTFMECETMDEDPNETMDSPNVSIAAAAELCHQNQENPSTSEEKTESSEYPCQLWEGERWIYHGIRMINKKLINDNKKPFTIPSLHNLISTAYENKPEDLEKKELSDFWAKNFQLFVRNSSDVREQLESLVKKCKNRESPYQLRSKQ